MIIDANIFLEMLLKQEKSEICKKFLNKTITGEIKAIISNFTIDSIIITMENNNVNTEEIILFLEKLINSKGIKIYHINMKDRILALSLKEKYNLDYEDSLILQTAVSTDSKEIISFDKHFNKTKEIIRKEPN